jgi:hypothetical protein
VQVGGEGGFGGLRVFCSGGFVPTIRGGGVDGGDGGGREGGEWQGGDSNFDDTTEHGVVANVGDVGDVAGSGPMRGTSPTGTFLRKCVRGIPRASNSGRSGSLRG